MCLAQDPGTLWGRGTEAERVYYWSGHWNCVSSVLLSLFIVLTSLTGLIDSVLCDPTSLFGATPLAKHFYFHWLGSVGGGGGWRWRWGGISLSHWLIHCVVSCVMLVSEMALISVTWEGLIEFCRHVWRQSEDFDTGRKTFCHTKEIHCTRCLSKRVYFTFSGCSCLLKWFETLESCD